MLHYTAMEATRIIGKTIAGGSRMGVDLSRTVEVVVAQKAGQKRRFSAWEVANKKDICRMRYDPGIKSSG